MSETILTIHKTEYGGMYSITNQRRDLVAQFVKRADAELFLFAKLDQSPKKAKPAAKRKRSTPK